MDIPLTGLGRTVRVGAVLVEMVDKVPAPDQMPSQPPMGEGNDVGVFVRQKGEGDDEGFVTLSTGDGPFDQTLPKQLENAIIERTREVHPGVEPDRSGPRI